MLPSLALLLALSAACVGCVRSGSAPLPGRDTPPPSSPHTSSAVTFVDRTAEAGIRFTHTYGGFGEKYMPESAGAGGAFLDFDNDGWLDILLLNGKPLLGKPKRNDGREPATDHRPTTDAAAPTPNTQHPTPNTQHPTPVLYHNNRDGTFTDVTKGSGLEISIYAMGCCVGDYDNDGREDVFITACNEPNRLFHNEGGGKFREVTETMGVGDARWGTSCAWVDYDRDGWLDLFVCNYVRYQWGKSDHGCYKRMDGTRAYCDPRYLPPQPSILYHNEAGRRFRDVSLKSGIGTKPGKALGVAVCDVDEDGWPDLLVANDLEPNFLFHNRRDGAFEEMAVQAGVALAETGEVKAGMGIDAADLLNDGKLAVLISNFSGEGLSLYRQDSPRALSFTDSASQAGMLTVSLNFLGFGLCFFDFDNDGWMDALVGNGHIQPDVHNYSTNLTYGERNLLFRNKGDGTFDEIGRTAGQPFTYERVTRGVAYGDYDNDGDLDLLIANNNGPAELLRNDSGNAQHWLQVELKGSGAGAGKGRRTNRSAIGAMVVVRADGKVQRQRVHSGSSYLSQSMLRLHFGLGAAARAEQVEVHWPSGVVDRLRDVAANQRLVVRERERA